MAKKNKPPKEAALDDFKLPRGSTFFRRFLKTIAYPFFRILFPMRVYNKKEVKQHRGKPVVFAFQHRSNTDVFVIFMAFPEFMLHFVGKESLFKPRTAINRFLRSLNGVPIRPGKNDIAIIRHCLAKLKKNESIAMFPEGRRNFSGEDALAVRNGTAVIALRAGVPIVPVVTNRRPRPFKLTKFKVGKTIWTNEYTDKNEISAKLRDDMAELLDGFEVKTRIKKWDKEPVQGVRAVTFVDGKLLAIKRTRGDEQYYVLPGGHVDDDETPRAAVVRELKDEANVTAEAVRVLYKSKYRDKMEAFYLCTYQRGKVSKTTSEEYILNPENLNVDDGKPFGSYEPVLLDVEDLSNIDLRGVSIKQQLIKDIKRYGTHLTRATKYVK